MPAGEIERSVREIEQKGGPPAEIAWLSWRRLTALLDGSAAPIFQDLALLLRRAMLVYVEGVARPAPPAPRAYRFEAGGEPKAPPPAGVFAWPAPGPCAAYTFDVAEPFSWPRFTGASSWRFDAGRTR